MRNVQFKLSNSDTLRTFNVDFLIMSYVFLIQSYITSLSTNMIQYVGVSTFIL